MTLFQAIIIGIIQGLTEFLPISSTAHIRVVPALLGWDDPGAAFTAVIQWGTLLAALIYFWPEIVRMSRAVFDDLFHQKFCKTPDGKLAWMIVLGTIPIVIIGLLFRKAIKTTLRSLYVISAAAIVLAVVLMLAEWYLRWREKHHARLRDIPDLGWWDAFLVGCAQAVALIPGVSRSGSTITAGLFAGMKRDAAARFSFLLSLPAIFAAGVLELYKDREALLGSGNQAINLLVSTVVSGIVGYASIVFLLEYLKKHSTYLFVIYRVVLGLALLGLLASGKLQPMEPGEGDDRPAAVSELHVVKGKS